MAGYQGEPERIWDEYQWERFLQQQEGKAEKYMRLLEEHLDDPQRDEIIAREMCWIPGIGARNSTCCRRKTWPKKTTVESTRHSDQQRPLKDMICIVLPSL